MWVLETGPLPCSISCAFHMSQNKWAQKEYVLATLFILCPEALVFLASSKRHPKEETKASDSTADYGTTGGSVP